jgi:CRISPR/Cas system-associated exonuclease Cas4 (RecB family)
VGHTETFIDGIWYPSVSTILGAQEKPWVRAWQDKWGLLATRKTEIACAIGTAFHHCIEQYINTGTFTVSMDTYQSCTRRVAGMMESWVDWAVNIDGTVDHTELKVISKMHTYSGTLDAVGMIGKTPVLIDWKTSSRIYDDMQLQLAAYAYAYNEQTGNKIKDGIIVHVSKDKPHFKLTTKTFKLGKRVFNKFLKLRDMFDKVQIAGVSNHE